MLPSICVFDTCYNVNMAANWCFKLHLLQTPIPISTSAINQLFVLLWLLFRYTEFFKKKKNF